MKPLLAAALVAAALPCAAQVHNYSSNVTVTGLHYELSGDAQFLDTGGYTSLEIRDRRGATERVDWTSDMLGASFVSGLRAGGSAFASVGFDSAHGVGLGAGGAGTMVGAKTTGVRTSYESRGEAQGYGLQVLLAPGARMVWTGSFEALASADRWWGTSALQAASAKVTVLSGLYGDTTPDRQVFGAAAFANPKIGASFDREAGNFSFTWANNTADAVRYSASIVASASGGMRPSVMASSAVAPIPEPSTYALMAAGLGVVAFVARRRRSMAR